MKVGFDQYDDVDAHHGLVDLGKAINFSFSKQARHVS